MDFAKSFSFVFNDPDWIKKVLLIALVSLIPVVGMLVLYGWALQIAKKVIRKDSEPLLLPELDFGAQLSLGFKYFVLNLVYMIPVFLIMIPLMIVTAGGDAAGMDSNTLSTTAAILSCLCGGIAFLYALAVALAMPMATGLFLERESIGDGLKLRRVFELVRAALVPDILAVLGTAVASFIGSLGTILCVVGIVVTMVYAYAVMMHLYAQAYNQGTELAPASV